MRQSQTEPDTKCHFFPLLVFLVFTHFFGLLGEMQLLSWTSCWKFNFSGIFLLFYSPYVQAICISEQQGNWAEALAIFLPWTSQHMHGYLLTKKLLQQQDPPP